MKCTGAPTEPSQLAVLAAEPPGRKRIELAVSVSVRIGPDGTATTSSMMSPKTTMRAAPAESGMQGGPRGGDLARDAHVVASEVEVDLEAAPARELDDAEQEERGHRLAGHSRGS